MMRLEALQTELHKRVADIDRFLGVLMDTGAVVRKLGDDAKPIVEVARKLLAIVWVAHNTFHGLPQAPAPPLLLQGGEEDGRC
ncbi:MAG TPA: hypothetical protein VMV72_19965 [Verrucomicrobiae bacterium]|nr:hypothetical protein [Verrucomicrobiae bacterium]